MLIDDLADDKFEFSAICLQETWVEGTDPDVSVYSLDAYICILLGATCSSHGGLLIYLHKNFQFAIRDFYSPNNLWEGQFVDIFGNGLNQKVTLCNIYRRPQDRNIDIDMFMNDLVPIIETLSREHSDKFFVGDFNLDLLKTDAREKYSEFLDLMINSDLPPKITLPTRFSEKKCIFNW